MESKKIRILVSSYLNFPFENRIMTLHCLLYSLLSQTYQNFEIIVHHDGPLENKSLKEKIELLDDRISFIETQERKKMWGFDVRHKLAIESKNIDYILFTNDDNYYMPVFLETFIKAFEEYDSELAFCNFIPHANGYIPVISEPITYKIDLGCYMTSYRLIKNTPWEDVTWIADGLYLEKLAAQTNPIKINNFLFVHN